MKVAQSCPTLCDPWTSPRNSPGQNTGVDNLSLLQGSSQLRDQTEVSHITGGFFTIWTTREAQNFKRVPLNLSLVNISSSSSFFFFKLKNNPSSLYPQLMASGNWWDHVNSKKNAQCKSCEFVLFKNLTEDYRGFPGGSDGKESACNAGHSGLIPELGRSLEKGMATHSRILGWGLPWTEEPDGLQSMRLQRVSHGWTTKHTHMEG